MCELKYELKVMRNWLQTVNLPAPEADEKMVMDSIERGLPLGDDAWVKRMARTLDLEHTLRIRGCPVCSRSASFQSRRK